MDDIYHIDDLPLYIGAYWPRLNYKTLMREGVTAIVNLMDEKLYTPPLRKFRYLYKGFPDETRPPDGYVEIVLKFIDKQIKEKNGTVLVHCSMGISRSGAMCAGWILKENPGWGWTDAVDYVRPFRMIYPAPEIRDAVLDYLESIEGQRRKL